MIRVRTAKSVMEQEEGLNYLWLQLSLPMDASGLSLSVQLPPGVHRLPNLSGCEEAMEEILLSSTGAFRPDELFIEIFTREPVHCGMKTMSFMLSYRDAGGYACRFEHHVPLHIVSEEDMEQLEIDEEVVRRLKTLQQTPVEQETSSDDVELRPCIAIRLDGSAYSDLEKKYRIEGALTCN